MGTGNLHSCLLRFSAYYGLVLKWFPQANRPEALAHAILKGCGACLAESGLWGWATTVGLWGLDMTLFPDWDLCFWICQDVNKLLPHVSGKRELAAPGFMPSYTILCISQNIAQNKPFLPKVTITVRSLAPWRPPILEVPPAHGVSMSPNPSVIFSWETAALAGGTKNHLYWVHSKVGSPSSPHSLALSIPTSVNLSSLFPLHRSSDHHPKHLSCPLLYPWCPHPGRKAFLTSTPQGLLLLPLGPLPCLALLSHPHKYSYAGL